MPAGREYRPLGVYPLRIMQGGYTPIFMIGNDLRWRVASAEYGPHKTVNNGFIRGVRQGVFSKIFAALSAKGGKPDRLWSTRRISKAHRTAASLLEKGLFPDVPDAARMTRTQSVLFRPNEQRGFGD